MKASTPMQVQEKEYSFNMKYFDELKEELNLVKNLSNL